jgi:hypothetical protein
MISGYRASGVDCSINVLAWLGNMMISQYGRGLQTDIKPTLAAYATVSFATNQAWSGSRTPRRGDCALMTPRRKNLAVGSQKHWAQPNTVLGTLQIYFNIEMRFLQYLKYIIFITNTVADKCFNKSYFQLLIKIQRPSKTSRSRQCICTQCFTFQRNVALTSICGPANPILLMYTSDAQRPFNNRAQRPTCNFP